MENRQTIESFHGVSREKTGVPKPVYTTVLTDKVTEFIVFWYPHPILTGPGLYNVSRAYVPIIKQEFTENFCP